MNKYDVGAALKLFYALLIVCGFFIYFALGVVIGRSVLIDHSAPTKLNISVSW